MQFPTRKRRDLVAGRSTAKLTSAFPSSTSDKSFEHAIQEGVARASKTLRDIKSAWVKEQEAQVQGGKITAYKVILKVTFVLDDAA